MWRRKMRTKAQEAAANPLETYFSSDNYELPESEETEFL
jgi:hypothetical protein